MSHPGPTDAAAAAIEAAFGGRWGVWLSDTGWWWATRTAALTPQQTSAGCIPFVHADNPDELTERIRQQEHLDPASPPNPGTGQPGSDHSRRQP